MCSYFQNFGNFDAIRLNPPAPIYDLALLALDDPDSGWTEADGDKKELSNYVVQCLKVATSLLVLNN